MEAESWKRIYIIQLMTFYSIGKWIVEEQQQGESRARYGQRVIKRLSEALTEQYGRGYLGKCQTLFSYIPR